MHDAPDPHQPVDRRLLAYRIVKQIVLLVAVIILVKLLFFDIVAVQGDQMAPTIVRGDRMLVFRLPFLPLVRAIAIPSRNRVALFDFPFDKTRGCLRIAGVSGDTVAIDSGVLKNSADAALRIPPPAARLLRELLPPEFAPRDYLPALRIPGPGDSFALGSLDLFHFFSVLSIIRQENPSSGIRLQPVLSVDSTASSDYVIADFALYKGRLDSVPDSSRYNWFFWNRLNSYLHQVIDSSRNACLSFDVFKDGTKVTNYRVKNRYVFLVADNWDRGLDSRYFGLIAADRVFGKPLCVLWSRDKKRLGKIIK
jgi:signal peptidase I